MQKILPVIFLFIFSQWEKSYNHFKIEFMGMEIADSLSGQFLIYLVFYYCFYV